MSAAVVAAAVASQQSAAAGAVSMRPAAVVHTPGPCPPAAESLAACVELGLIADNGDGTYRALMRGRTGPTDDGRVE